MFPHVAAGPQDAQGLLCLVYAPSGVDVSVGFCCVSWCEDMPSA
jgi:hypothetical protein